MAAQKRIGKEFAQCVADPPAGMTIALPDEADMHKWHITMHGPSNSAYAGGQFGLVVDMPAEYPFKPPTVTFATRIYHPNVTNDSAGSICIADLKPENWKPASKLLGVLESIRNLLIEPNPDDPLEARIAEEYRNNRKEWEKQVKFYVGKYAKNPPTFASS